MAIELSLLKQNKKLICSIIFSLQNFFNDQTTGKCFLYSSVFSHLFQKPKFHAKIRLNAWAEVDFGKFHLGDIEVILAHLILAKKYLI